MTDLQFAIDVPDPHDLEAPMINMGYFETRKEAAAWAREHLGTDDDGKLDLVSEFPAEGEKG